MTSIYFGSQLTREWPPPLPKLFFTPGCACIITLSQLNRKKSGINNQKRFPCTKTSFWSVQYTRMLSYLPCDLSAERSYIQRKAHLIKFFSSNWSWRHDFFLLKINKAYKSYKTYLFQKILSKSFSGIKHSAFQNWDECDWKNLVICILTSCVIWCVVLIPAAFPLFD